MVLNVNQNILPSINCGAVKGLAGYSCIMYPHGCGTAYVDLCRLGEGATARKAAATSAHFAVLAVHKAVPQMIDLKSQLYFSDLTYSI
jgi:hypothetical protein